ncbi:MAG: glycosyltransferase [Gammaproteobacteria bacterium]|nr:glycosyltransferase [Gammaproteobacteria bacterium]
MNNKITTRAPGSGPSLCIVARKLGRTSEVWLWRQIAALDRVRPSVLTWEWLNREEFALPGVVVKDLAGKPWPEKNNIKKRWAARLERTWMRNYYAAAGSEKAHLHAAIAELRPDLLLCHTGPVALQMLPVAKALAIPIFAHFHGRDLSAALNEVWYRYSLRRCASEFSGIVVVNEGQKARLVHMGVPEERIHIIPCGAPMPDVTAASGRSKGDIIRFIGVSRLVEKKGITYTLKAFSEVLESVPNSELILIGSGPQKQELVDLARSLGIANEVDFRGSLPNHEVQNLLSSADIFVQHSVVAADDNDEGSPVSVAEAAAWSLPVVATSGVGGMDRLVVHEKTGFLVQQRDVKDMAEKMQCLAADPSLRNRFGRAARELLIDQFELHKQVAKLERALLGDRLVSARDVRAYWAEGHRDNDVV